MIDLEIPKKLLVWPKEYISSIESNNLKNVSVSPLPQKFIKFVFYDIFDQVYPKPQIFLNVFDDLKLISIGEKNLENLPNLVKSHETITKNTLIGWYRYTDDEILYKDVELSNDVIEEFKGLLQVRFKYKLTYTVVELLLKSLHMETSYIFSPKKHKVAEMLTFVLDYINETNEENEKITYSVNDLKEDVDFLIFTSPTYDEVFTYNNNLIFILDGEDIAKAPEDLLRALKMFSNIEGYIC